MDKNIETVYNFIMDKVIGDKQEEAKKLLDGVFSGASLDNLDMSKVKEVGEKILTMVKPDSLDEVKGAIETFTTGSAAKGLLDKVKSLF
ncbi:MAG: hypothetical protein ACK5LZ_01975 [Anaerorhabdus sp.]